ncbi:DotI/IcmL/TraM family protein [Alteromonas antoniana]|uniref:DotI/IcmL/TraM family protein n=1 Tax=Alteromonas antoniana TaxID=2803813 RepID=UPI001C461312|nr:DotI/IcmL/TraM family protein [Alteromonas antoniana]
MAEKEITRQSRAKRAPRSEKPAPSKKKPGLAGQATELLFSQYMRTLIYKNSFSATVSVTKLSMALNMLLVVALIVLIAKPEQQPTVLGLQEDGRFIELTPLDQNVLSARQLTTWAEDCVLELNSYTFYTAIQHLNKVVPRCFTGEAGNSFMRNFQKNVLQDIRTYEQSFEASLDGAGIITAEGVVDGRKAYRIEIPLLITRYDQDRESRTFRFLIKLQIIRVSQQEFHKGVKIYKYEEA